MKKHEFAKLNSGHQKILKAFWDLKRRKMTEGKSSSRDSQIKQSVSMASVDTVKSNLK